MLARAVLVCAPAFFLLALVPTGSRAAGNVPFKTSFVASSEYAVRRSGPLSPLPLANPESQHQPESISGYDAPIDESVFLLKTRDFDSIRRQDTPVGLHHEDQPIISSQAEDLVAASSAQSNREADSSRDQVTTLATVTSTLSAPVSSSRSTGSVPTTAPTFAGTIFDATPSSAATSSTPFEPATSSATSVTTAAPTTSTGASHNLTSTSTSASILTSTSSPASTLVPTFSSTTTHSPTSTEIARSSTTTQVTTTSGYVNPSTTVQAGGQNTTELVRPTESSTPVIESVARKAPKGPAGRSLPCDRGDTNCNYVVASVPVIDASGNKSRVVSEFLLVPEEPTLNFEDSSYPTHKPDREPELATLRAEHRTVDSDSPSDELELDYVNVEPIEPRFNARTASPLLTSTSSTSSAPLKVSSSSTTPLPAVTETARVTSSSSAPVASQRLQSSSVRVESSLRVESGSSSETSGTDRARLMAPSATTSASVTRASSVRPNQKLLRLNELASSTSTTTSTSTSTTTTTTTTTTTSAPIVRRLPAEPTRRVISNNRRPKSEHGQHRAYFGEPKTTRRRTSNANASNLSPVVNGADEEEANILTRYSVPSQLSRLSAPVTSSTVRNEQLRTNQPQRRFTSSTTSTTSKPRDLKYELRDYRRDGSTHIELNERRKQVTTTTQLPIQINRKLSSTVAELRAAAAQATTPESSTIELEAQNSTQVSIDQARRAERVEPLTMTLISSSVDIDPAPKQSKEPQHSAPEVQQPEISKVPVTEVTPPRQSTPGDVSRYRTVTSARHQPSGELIDEFEGSVEDQLAKDALHSRASNPAHHGGLRKLSNTYSRSTSKSRDNPATGASIRQSVTASSDDLVRNEESPSQQQMPGRPGIDYPVHWQVPKTSFDCRNYEQSGFYADIESDCQAYHSCHKGRGGRHTFLCPNGTLFSQELLTCDWWYNVECSATKLYMPNESAKDSGRT